MAHARDKTVLVVEDEPDVRMFLSACAEDGGFQVVTAEDGVAALEQLERLTPDLITVDMVMPRMNGIALLRHLRDNPAWASIPVVLITAHMRDELGDEAVKQLLTFDVEHRPKLVVEKPINPPELMRLIAEILDVELDDDDYEHASSQQSLSSSASNRDTQALQAINARLRRS